MQSHGLNGDGVTRNASVKIATGTYAEVVNDTLVPMNNGMIGKITRIFKFEGDDWYEITAENYGPYMKGTSGAEKKVRAWVRGNHRALPLSKIRLRNS